MNHVVRLKPFQVVIDRTAAEVMLMLRLVQLHIALKDGGVQLWSSGLAFFLIAGDSVVEG